MPSPYIGLEAWFKLVINESFCYNVSLKNYVGKYVIEEINKTICAVGADIFV